MLRNSPLSSYLEPAVPVSGRHVGAWEAALAVWPGTAWGVVHQAAVLLYIRALLAILDIFSWFLFINADLRETGKDSRSDKRCGKGKLAGPWPGPLGGDTAIARQQVCFWFFWPHCMACGILVP